MSKYLSEYSWVKKPYNKKHPIIAKNDTCKVIRNGIGDYTIEWTNPTKGICFDGTIKGETE